jgi:hypothetical protein
MVKDGPAHKLLGWPAKHNANLSGLGLKWRLNFPEAVSKPGNCL